MMMTSETLLEHSGASGTLMRANDWSATPLGPSEAWPARVTAIVEMVLASGFPLAVVLGPQPSSAIVMYNDPFIAFLGHKHPAAMGRRAREVWPEMWDFFEWALGQVWRSSQPVTGKDLQLRVSRSDQNEEIYATISFSPIHDEGGAVCGALVCCIETTAAVLSTRRLRVLSRIAAGLSQARARMSFTAPSRPPCRPARETSRSRSSTCPSRGADGDRPRECGGRGRRAGVPAPGRSPDRRR